MNFDPLIDEISLIDVRRMAKILGPYSAFAAALEWMHNSKELCYFFRTKRGELVAVAESFVQKVGDLKNIEIEKHFIPIPESQFVQCLHCGKRKIANQGLAKLAHLAKCTGSGARRNS